MGIKSAIIHAADKAGNAVAKVSSLSSEQLKQVEEKRDSYLSQKPDPTDATATELTNRLLATAAVEIHGAYLSQLRNVYCPVDPAVEYPDGFNDEFNIRYMDITKWVVDPNEDSLEKLVNVYDVLADEDCNIALVFNRTSMSTNVYLAVVDTDNASDNIDVDNFTRRVSDALKGNFPGSEVGAPQRGALPCLERNRSYSVATVSNIPTEKNDKFATQTIEKLLDGIVPKSSAEEYTVVLLATPAHDVRERKLRLAELHSLLTPYASWTTNYTYHQSGSIASSATIGVNAGVNAGRQAGTNQSVANNYNETDSTNSSQTDSVNRGTSQSETTTESITDTESNGTSESTQGGANVVIANVNHTQGSSHSTSTAKCTSDAIGKSVSNSLGKAVTWYR